MAIECVVCDEPLENISPEGFQPDDGVAFLSYGHYGSTLFDPMDGTFIELAICDRCLHRAADKGQVVTRAQTPRIVTVERKPWAP